MTDATGRARRTKIVATIGPASDDPATLRGLVEAGMDMARLSLAHGPVEPALERLRRVRQAAADCGREVGILADLPGPKVRAGVFPDGGVFLSEGDRLELVPVTAGDGARSDARTISVDHPELLSGLEPGDMVALGDGGAQLDVVDVRGDGATVVVRSGGRLQGRPGVNLPERFSAPTPTEADLRLLRIMSEAGVDAIAISFVRRADDVRAVRNAAGGGVPMLIAKIETRTAVADINDIIETADGVMVARGDLGVRTAMEDVPHLQKRIIKASVSFGRPVITATQMLESMVHSPSPTRAEVADIANAVFDGTSALMLSAETAIGHDPVGVVRTMSRIALRAEREFDYAGWGANLGRQQSAASSGASPAVRITSAVTAAAWRAAADCDAAAIICCTNTGATVRGVARFRPTAPLYAFTPSSLVARQLTVAWGVNPVATQQYRSADEIVWYAVQHVVATGVARHGDIVVVIVGSEGEAPATSDVLRLVEIR